MKKHVVFKQDYTSLGMPGATGYSAACIRAGNYVYITGQVAFTLDGVFVGVDDPGAQARQAMENIKILIEMAGGALTDVLKIVVYVTDRSYRAAIDPVIREYFPDVWPCETAFVVKGLARPDLFVEIDAWGFVDDAKTQKQLVHAQDFASLGVQTVSGRVAQCYRAGNLVYLRGQEGRGFDGRLVGPGDPGAQAAQVASNLTALMEMAGGTSADVFRMINAVSEREYRRESYPVMLDFYRGVLPAGTGLVMEGMATPEAQFEHDAWGWIDSPEAPKRVIRTMDVAPARFIGNDSGRAIQCVRAGNWVCLQGQVGWSLEDAQMVGIGDPAAQTRQAMDNIKTLIEMAGGAVSDIVRVIVYVTDREVRRDVYPVIREYVGDLWPCGSGIIVKGLAREEFVVEIDAYGFIDDPD